jgi:predicted nuclease with TOPRIM domain
MLCRVTFLQHFRQILWSDDKKTSVSGTTCIFRLLKMLFLYRNHSKMTEKDQHLIEELRMNIRRLMESLDASKSELIAVKEEYRNLEERFVQLSSENEELKKRYENLKVAKVLAEGDPDTQAAKQKITKLIREVDKCIALLNQ